MQAILLAGGLGTRLRSVVSDRPKPMALIEGRPFMEYVTRELVRHGIADIIFAVGYKGSMVEEHFGDGSAYGFKAAYAYEETLLGTAGAIKNAGRLITEDRFFVLNADTFYQIDYTRLTRLQDEMNLDMALVLREVPDVSRYGQAVLDGAGVRWQICELGKIDAGGGGTVAQYMANRNITTLDAGVPVLSMHAPFETVSKLDCYETYKGMKAVFQAEK